MGFQIHKVNVPIFGHFQYPCSMFSKANVTNISFQKYISENVSVEFIINTIFLSFHFNGRKNNHKFQFSN